LGLIETCDSPWMKRWLASWFSYSESFGGAHVCSELGGASFRAFAMAIARNNCKAARRMDIVHPFWLAFRSRFALASNSCGNLLIKPPAGRDNLNRSWRVP